LAVNRSKKDIGKSLTLTDVFIPVGGSKNLHSIVC